MTDYINYTNDRFLDRDLNELARIENKLNSLPSKPTSLDMEAGMIMLKDEQGILRRQIERKVIHHRLENPLESKKYLDSIKQPMSNQNSLNSLNSNASNNRMRANSQSSNINTAVANQAAQSVQQGRPRIHPSRFKLSKNLDNFIRKEEGYRPTLYPDTADNPTIGIGHKVVNGEYKVGDTITREQAEKHFAEDKETARKYALQLVGGLPMHRYEFESIVDAMYNVGPGNLGLGTNKSPDLNTAINAGDYTEIGNNLIYTKDSFGNRQPGLIRRSDGRTNMYKGNFGDY